MVTVAREVGMTASHNDMPTEPDDAVRVDGLAETAYVAGDVGAAVPTVRDGAVATSAASVNW